MAMKQQIASSSLIPPQLLPHLVCARALSLSARDELENVATFGIVSCPDFFQNIHVHHFQYEAICARVGLGSGTETTFGLE